MIEELKQLRELTKQLTGEEPMALCHTNAREYLANLRSLTEQLIQLERGAYEWSPMSITTQTNSSAPVRI